jgi:hypothetical protein
LGIVPRRFETTTVLWRPQWRERAYGARDSLIQIVFDEGQDIGPVKRQGELGIYPRSRIFHTVPKTL